MTYGRLGEHMHEVVRVLNASGLGRHDRIAVVLPQGPELAVAFLTLAAGAVCAPLNPAYGSSEFDFCLGAMNARALVVARGLDSPARAVARARRIPIIELVPAPATGAGAFRLVSPQQATPPAGGFAQPEDVALVLATSGTTGGTKLVGLTHVNVRAAAANTGRALGLTPRDRCLGVMPLVHGHGVIATLLSSVTAGASIACLPGFDAERFFSWMSEYRPTWYSAVPTMHQAILGQASAHEELIADCRLRFVRSASATLSAALAEDLERVFGAPVTNSYGLTEALQLTNVPLTPGATKTGSLGVAAADVDVAIMDEAGAQLPPGQRGEIVARGSVVMHGYEGDPAATAASFRNGWLRTGDEGLLDEDGHLFVTGRFKEMINRGGEKIAPYEIEAVLLEHPWVAQAAVFAVPHPTLGEDVGAAVVLRPRTEVSSTELRAFVARRLASFKVPRRVVRVPEIPSGLTGKVRRVGLAAELGLTGEHEAGYVPPDDELELQLCGIWEDALERTPVGVLDDFFEMGGDSLQAARLFSRIEAMSGRRLPLATLLEASTVRDLARLIRREGWQPSWRTAVPLQSRGTQPPLFAVPGVGGNVLSFVELARALGPDQPLYGLRAVGLDGRRPPFTRMADIAADHLEKLRAVQPHGPYFLLGACMGAAVVFEMAQQLRGQGECVGPLLLLDPPDPHRRPERDDSRPPGRAHALGRLLAGRLALHVRELGRRPLRDKLGYLLGKARVIGDTLVTGAHVAAGRELDQIHVVEANRHALRTYVPRHYGGPVTIVLASRRPGAETSNPRLAWAALVGSDVEIQLIEASDSGTMLREPHVARLATLLDYCLRGARAAF